MNNCSKIFPNRLKGIVNLATQMGFHYLLWAQCWHTWLALLHVRGSGVSLSASVQDVV